MPDAVEYTARNTEMGSWAVTVTVGGRPIGGEYEAEEQRRCRGHCSA